ncbi:class I SAM-dependent methyltransferase [Opitutaceae bacterium]
MEDSEYHKLAAVEDRMWYFRALHRHAMERLAPNWPSALLDAGCGTGGFLRRLMRLRPETVAMGIDLSPIACQLARERCQASIMEGSVTALPFDDHQFDAVTSLDVIYHLDDHMKALAEYFRVLRPGGRAVINVPAYMWLWSYHDEACHGRHRYTRPELERMLSEVGFEVEKGTYWNSIPFPLIVVKRKMMSRPTDTSDVRMYPAWAEWLLDAAMSCEHAWIRAIGPLPMGCSVLVSARKPIPSR